MPTQVKIPTVAIVENMSFFLCDGCDKRHEIFQSGSGVPCPADFADFCCLFKGLFVKRFPSVKQLRSEYRMVDLRISRHWNSIFVRAVFKGLYDYT